MCVCLMKAFDRNIATLNIFNKRRLSVQIFFAIYLMILFDLDLTPGQYIFGCAYLDPSLIQICTTHIFNFQTGVIICTTTNAVKHCQIHVHLCQIKLNMVVAPLTGHLTLKVLQNVQEPVIHLKENMPGLRNVVDPLILKVRF